MSFQAYIDNIKQKTGKSPDDFKNLAKQRGLLEESVKTRQIVDWLKHEFDLGHGHAMAIVSTLQATPEAELSPEERVGAHFNGTKERWRLPFDALTSSVKTFGEDVAIKGGGSYITFLRRDKKFAIAVVGSTHIDLGIKLKGVAPTGRFDVAGKWNSMVTHRVRISSASQFDDELLSWLRQAYLAQ